MTKTPRKINRKWLRHRIKNDPDVETEAGITPMTHTPMTPEEVDAVQSEIAERQSYDPDQLYDNWEQDARLIATVRAHYAEIERLESEATGLTQGVFVDPGANPVVSWKSRAEEAEAEIESYKEQYAAVTDLADNTRNDLEQAEAERDRLRNVVLDALLVLDPNEETMWAKSARTVLQDIDSS